MGWAVGYDYAMGRWRGYGVPAYCDHPGCRVEIDRGFAYACCDSPLEDNHCGGFYCAEHQGFAWSDDGEGDERVCPHTERPSAPEHPDWLRHVLTDESWAKWRAESPGEVAAYQRMLQEAEAAQGSSNGA